MFGLDSSLAHLSDGVTVLVVVGVAILLGLRHATDPDHLAAVTTLIASGQERTRRLAARLGLAWGLGHATSLFVFGLPIVLFKAFLPSAVQEGAETAVGFLIVALAAWLLIRWRRGLFHLHLHEHGPLEHVHAHAHSRPDGPSQCNALLPAQKPRADHAHPHTIRARSPLQAYAIGLVHGVGGSAGVGVLLLASIPSHSLAVVCLAVFAFCTALSMSLLSSGFGLTLSRPRVRRSFSRVAPALGFVTLAFGVWYALGSQSLVPYVF
jgi:ABC-type nickel/cobalt efflux system permease component RcnA